MKSGYKELFSLLLCHIPKSAFAAGALADIIGAWHPFMPAPQTL
jgi:hypothetical protein